MKPTLLITFGVVLSYAAAALCLRKGLTVPGVFAAIFAATVVGSVYVVGAEVILSDFPADPRYYSMALPRFAFQGGFAGTVIGLVACFVRGVYDVAREGPGRPW